MPRQATPCKARYKLGKDLKVGDTIDVWWSPGHDTITALRPYEGVLSYLWEKDGGAMLADFAISKVGMTIEPHSRHEIVHSVDQTGIFEIE